MTGVYDAIQFPQGPIVKSDAGGYNITFRNSGDNSYISTIAHTVAGVSTIDCYGTYRLWDGSNMNQIITSTSGVVTIGASGKQLGIKCSSPIMASGISPSHKIPVIINGIQYHILAIIAE